MALSPELAYQFYAPNVLQWARQYGQEDQAEDFASEAWCMAIRGWHTFRADEPGANLLGWLRTVLKNVVRMHYRRKTGVQVSLEHYMSRPPSRDYGDNGSGSGGQDTFHRVPRQMVCEDDVSHVFQDESVVRTIGVLAPEYRDALLLRLSGVPESKAAAALGISTKAFNQRIFRARHMLQEIVSPNLSPGRTVADCSHDRSNGH